MTSNIGSGIGAQQAQAVHILRANIHAKTQIYKSLTTKLVLIKRTGMHLQFLQLTSFEHKGDFMVMMCAVFSPLGSDKDREPMD